MIAKTSRIVTQHKCDPKLIHNPKSIKDQNTDTEKEIYRTVKINNFGTQRNNKKMTPKIIEWQEKLNRSSKDPKQ